MTVCLSVTTLKINLMLHTLFINFLQAIRQKKKTQPSLRRTVIPSARRYRSKRIIPLVCTIMQSRNIKITT